MAHHLSGEQDFENAQCHQALIMCETGNPVFEKGFWEIDFCKDKDDGLNNIEGEAEECSEFARWLVWNTRVFYIVATLEVLIVDAGMNSVDIFNQNENVGDEDEKKGDKGECAQAIEKEKLGFGG